MSHPVENEAYLLRKLDSLNNTDLQVHLIFAFTITNCTMLILTLFVGLAANVFVIWAVIHQKSLRTSNNALVVNLATIDLLRCAVDCPLILSVLLRGHGVVDLGVLLCDAQIMSFSFSCCVQLLTLASISADRYQAIANPFQTKQRRIRVMVWIPLTWTVALLLSVVCMTRARDTPVYIKCRGIRTEIMPAYNTFGRYILIPVWSGCFALVTGFYGRIFCIVRMHNKKIFDHGIFLPSKNKPETVVDDGNERANAKSSTLDKLESKKTEQETPKAEFSTARQPAATETEDRASTRDELLSARTLKTCTSPNTLVTSPDETANRLPPGTVEFTKDCQKQSEKQTKMVSFDASTSAPTAVEPPLLIDLEGSKSDSAPVPNKAVDVNVEEVPPLSVGEAYTDAQPNQPADESAEIVGAVCMMPSLANRERGIKNKESKLAKRSGYIILTFLLFWTPLISSLLVNFFVHRRKNTTTGIALEVEILSISVAYMTSATNPITYAALNPQFRTEFRNLRAKYNVRTLCSKP